MFAAYNSTLGGSFPTPPATGGLQGDGQQPQPQPQPQQQQQILLLQQQIMQLQQQQQQFNLFQQALQTSSSPAQPQPQPQPPLQPQPQPQPPFQPFQTPAGGANVSLPAVLPPVHQGDNTLGPYGSLMRFDPLGSMGSLGSLGSPSFAGSFPGSFAGSASSTPPISAMDMAYRGFLSPDSHASPFSPSPMDSGMSSPVNQGLPLPLPTRRRPPNPSAPAQNSATTTATTTAQSAFQNLLFPTTTPQPQPQLQPQPQSQSLPFASPTLAKAAPFSPLATATTTATTTTSSAYSSEGAFFESAMAALHVAADATFVPVTPPPLYDPASLNYSVASASSTRTSSQSGYATSTLGEAQLTSSPFGMLKQTSASTPKLEQPIAGFPNTPSTIESYDALLARVTRKDLDWCGEFQVASDAFQIARDWNEYEGEKGMILANAAGDLSQLAQDFVSAARTYGTVILNEYHLPYEAKTIKPVSVGGVAGGDKYLVPTCNILFKLATDRHGIYGGLENAQRAANHELRSLIAIYNCGVPGLHVPLMAIISHRGMRLIAETLVPVRGSETIKYGSSDQGRTVHADILELNTKMEYLGKLLNLKPYYFKGKLMHVCTDIEAHQGFDGRYYLLDFARALPPSYAPRLLKSSFETGERYATPEEGVGATKSTHMYQLFRPSFVRSYKVPLCSEGLSRMQEASDVALHSEELKKATSFLHEVIIPKFVQELEELSDNTSNQYPKLFDFTGRFHRVGINARLLGVVYQSCATEHWKTVALYEMVSRAAKNISRKKMRELMESQGRLSDVGARNIMAQILTLLLFNVKLVRGSNSDSRIQYQKEVEQATTFWENELPEYISSHFPLLRNGTLVEGDTKFWAQACRALLTTLDRNRLLTRIIQMLDLSLTKPGVQRRYEQMEYTVPFHATEIEDVPAQISHMDLVTQASGVMLLAQGLQMKGKAAISTLKMAIEKLEEACPYFQYGHSALFDVANAYYAVGIRESSDEALTHLKEAKDKFAEALDLHPTRVTYKEAVRVSKRALDYAGWDCVATLKGSNSPIEAVSIMKDGRVLTGSRDGVMRTWDIQKKRVLSAWQAFDVPIWNIQYIRCATGVLVVTSSGNPDRTSGEVRAWRLPITDQERQRREMPVSAEQQQDKGELGAKEKDDAEVSSVEIEPPNSRLILTIRLEHSPVVRALCHMEEDDMSCGDDQGRLSILHGHRTSVVRDWTGHSGPVTSIVYDAERHVLISGSRDKDVHIWDLRTDGRPAATIAMRDPVTRLRLRSGARSGDQAFVAMANGDIAWVDLRRPAELRRVSGHIAGVSDLCFVPSTNILFSASADHAVRMYDPDDHRCFKVAAAHEDAVTALDWHQGHAALVAAGRDRTLRVFADAKKWSAK